MFARLRKTLGNAVRTVFYWVGWGLAVLVIAQAIILAVTTGNALIPLLLGGIGATIGLMALGLKAER